MLINNICEKEYNAKKAEYIANIYQVWENSVNRYYTQIKQICSHV